MKQWDLDETITDIFKAEVAQVSVDEKVKRNIDRALAKSQHKEEKGMKRFNIKKVSVIGIAAALLSVTMVFASGQVSSLVSHSNSFMICKDYAKLSKQEAKLGYSVKITDAFSNGYNFEGMEVGNVEGLDEAGNVVETYKDLDVYYTNKAGNRVSLNANQRNVGSDFRAPVQTLQWGETTLYYYQDTYKFVPADYVLTEEDKLNLAREDYEISFGSSEVEFNMMSSVSWEKDGVRYHLLAVDTEMSADEMLEMASELVQ